MQRYRDRNPLRILWLLAVVWLPLMQGCAEYMAMPEEAHINLYVTAPTADPMVRQWAPAFEAYGYGERFNRIGRPEARLTGGGNEAIDVNPDHPVIYVMQRDFTTDKGRYHNIIYRVHFPEVPYSLIPFHLTAGDNVGLLVVVTLNEQGEPLLVTTVHTCGCYLAIVPTDYLPRADLPEGWNGQPLDVYGETLPAGLSYRPVEHPRLVISLRPGVHRVTNLAVVPADRLRSARYTRIPMAAAPMSDLLKLPFQGAATSFYYNEGLLRGHVKGSVKPFETLLMSPMSLDLFVGSDKMYADPTVSGNHFYTSLKPWRRTDSDMWDFARFLRYWGWRL